MSKGQDTLTVDKDDQRGAYDLREALLMLGVDAEWRISSSGTGYHFRIFLNREADREHKLLLRWMLGDDFGRVAGDFRRYTNDIDRFGVLFYRKNGSETSEWVDIEDDLPD